MRVDILENSANNENMLLKIKKIYDNEGFLKLIKSIMQKPINSIEYYFYKTFDGRTFTFQNKQYKYLCHPYNFTWKNERAVEVPIIWEIVKKYKGKNILEVGNVLSHYFDVNHDIVDKYEKADGVINEDICDFKTSKKYDLIVSISTIEHVGWDENPEDSNKILNCPEKILKAIDNLKSLVSENGKIVITLPIGYNPELDKLLQSGKIQFKEMHCLKRVSIGNRWVETNWDDVKNIKYNFSLHTAEGVVILIL